MRPEWTQERLVRKEDSNFECKALIVQFLFADAKPRTLTRTRTIASSNPRGPEQSQCSVVFANTHAML